MPSLNKAARHYIPKEESRGTDNFYRSPLWRMVRKQTLRDVPYCVHCKKQGKIVQATVVDHIRPRRLWPSREIDNSNLQGLCDSCHATKSAYEKNAGSRQAWERIANEQEWL